MGKGGIDKEYYKTVTVMGDIAKQEEGDNLAQYQMEKYLTPQKIAYQSNALLEGGLLALTSCKNGFFETLSSRKLSTNLEGAPQFTSRVG